MDVLFDTNSKVSPLNKKLAKKLSLNLDKYTSTLQVASGASVHFVGQLPSTRLQMYDLLVVVIEGIRIINEAANCISNILSIDVFNPEGKFFINVIWKKKENKLL